MGHLWYGIRIPPAPNIICKFQQCYYCNQQRYWFILYTPPTNKATVPRLILVSCIYIYI
jgi:hypothetical protein